MKNYGKSLTLLAATALASVLLLGAASSQPVKAATSNSATPVYVYRLYNSSTGEHLYSSDANEVATLTGEGWSYENVVFDAPSSGTAVDRLYNSASGQHVYSSDSHEQSVLTSSGWKNEGEVFYVSSSSSSSTGLGITRLYNSASGQHLFSSDSNEIKTLTSQGWKNEGIMGYAAQGTSQSKPTLPSNPTPPATTGMNLTQIAKGDYSCIQGTWVSANDSTGYVIKESTIADGDTGFVQFNGLTFINFPAGTGEFPITPKLVGDGTLTYQCYAGNNWQTVATFIPKGVVFSIIGANGNQISSDSTKDRILIGVNINYLQ